jgi:hypothetical protein
MSFKENVIKLCKQLDESECYAEADQLEKQVFAQDWSDTDPWKDFIDQFPTSQCDILAGYLGYNKMKDFVGAIQTCCSGSSTTIKIGGKDVKCKDLIDSLWKYFKIDVCKEANKLLDSDFCGKIMQIMSGKGWEIAPGVWINYKDKGVTFTWPA